MFVALAGSVVVAFLVFTPFVAVRSARRRERFRRRLEEAFERYERD
jgi:Flp pilus assembly protein TadB